MRAAITKILILLVTLGGIATFAIPMMLDRQQRRELLEEFEPALKHFRGLAYAGQGKDGSLPFGTSIESLNPSDLPVIPGQVFIMTPGKRIPRLNNWEDVPARIHDSFYELSDDLRADSPSSIRTLVLAVPQVSSEHYSRSGRGATTRMLTQKSLIVSVYDLKKQVLLGCWTLEGEVPPASFEADRMPDLAPPPSAARFIERCPLHVKM